jgi:ferredoxin
VSKSSDKRSELAPRPLDARDSRPVDLMDAPFIGRFLRWRHARTALQIPLLIISILMVLHGIFGPALAPKNLATTVSWVHFRGALVFVLLLAGNFFCLACPFMLPRQLARRFFRPRHNWPQKLRNKWFSIALFVLILFVYELFDLWSSPWWTAWLILGYFLAILFVDGTFKHATFCKFVCPIGQFNFVASTISPLEVRVRDQEVCADCRTKDCIRGRHDGATSAIVIQRGCELALFQPQKVGIMDCTFCLDCVQACPHDNVGILSRLPASELAIDAPRSGVGYFSRRKDLAALSVVFTFGALLNAFGMTSPVYAAQSWLGGVLGVNREAPILGLIFVAGLIIEPVLLLLMAAWLTKKWGGSRIPTLPLIIRHSHALVPLGFGIWLSHYGFHFLRGLYTVIPVFQSALADAGWPILGRPMWGLGGLPENAVYPMEMGFLGLGFLGSLLVIYRLADEDPEARTARVFSVWAGLCLLLWASAMWLLSQPMEMRGTIMGG